MSVWNTIGSLVSSSTGSTVKTDVSTGSLKNFFGVLGAAVAVEAADIGLKKLRSVSGTDIGLQTGFQAIPAGIQQQQDLALRGLMPVLLGGAVLLVIVGGGMLLLRKKR